MSNNSKQPLISIVLPSYNHAKYLKECIDSALNQTYSNIELIITDDSSSDSSRDIISSYNDKRIKAFFLKKNHGGAYTTNFCIKKSSGEFISILNSDDVYTPKKLEDQYDFLSKNPDVSAVFSYAQAINENSQEITLKNNPLEPKISVSANRTDMLKIFLTYGNVLIHPSALIRKKVYQNIGMYDCRLHQIPDFEYWVRMCSCGYTIKVIPKKLIKYRFRDNELNTSNGNRSDVSNRLIFEYQYLLNNYYKLSIPDIKKTFSPIPENYKNISNQDKEFIVSQLLFKLQKENNELDSVYKLTALNHLFETINKSKNKKYLNKKYFFNYPQLIKQTGEYKLFNPISNTYTLDFFQSNKFKNELDEIKNSKSWKIVTLFRTILDKIPIMRKLTRIIFKFTKICIEFFKRIKKILKTIVIQSKPIKSNSEESNLLEIISINTKLDRISNSNSKYLFFLDKNDRLSQECLDVCLFITESFGIECIQITNRKENNSRYFIARSALRNKNIKIYQIKDDFHLIEKYGHTKNNKYISSKISKKKYTNIFPFNVKNPFINLKKEKDIGTLFVLPFILNSPNHLTTTLIKTFKENNYNCFIVSTEDVFPKYLNIGDGFQELSKYSKNIFYLTEIISKNYWYVFFQYLIVNRNIKYIFNIGSEYCYEIINKIKNNFPWVKIIDIQFNDYGHIQNHIKNINSIDMVFTESKKTKQSLIAKGSIKEKIKIVKTGTNLEVFNLNLKTPKTIDDNKKTFYIKPTQNVISFLGRLSEEKNPELFIKIAEKFKNDQNIVFLMAGDGPLKKQIIEEIQRSNINNIHLLGQQDPRQILSVTDILLLTSTIDGSPSSIREAMVLGIPVIAPNVGGISEMVNTEKTGFVIENHSLEKFTEKIKYLIENKKIYNRMSKESLVYGRRNFNEKKLLKRYVGYLNKIQ